MLERGFNYIVNWLNTYFFERIIKNVFTYESVIPLILVNSIPLFGVIFFSWSIHEIMVIYSLENIVIGFYNVLRLLKVEYVSPRYSRGYTIIFFIFHYGLFCFGHLLFSYVLTLDPNGQSSANYLIIPFAGLFISHGYSYLRNYIGKEEYKSLSTEELFIKPYSRIFINHIAIVLGAFVTIFLGKPIGMLILLILLKTIVDIVTHIKSHVDYEGKINRSNLENNWDKPLIVGN